MAVDKPHGTSTSPYLCGTKPIGIVIPRLNAASIFKLLDRVSLLLLEILDTNIQSGHKINAQL